MWEEHQQAFNICMCIGVRVTCMCDQRLHLWGSQNKLQIWPSPLIFKGRAIFLLLYCFSTIAGPQASGLFSCLVFLACGLRTQVLRLEQQVFYCCKENAYFLIQGKGEHICLVLKKLWGQSDKPDSHTGASWRSCPRKKWTSLSHENALEAQPWVCWRAVVQDH